MTGNRGTSGVWSQRLVFGVVLVLVVVVAVSALLSSGHKAALAPKTTPPPPPPTPLTGTSVSFTARRCTAGDLKASIELRRPTQRQRTGVFASGSSGRAATIILRNVGHRRCLN